MYVAFSQDERFKRVKWEPILERKITIVDYSAVETKKNQRTNRKIKWLECREWKNVRLKNVFKLSIFVPGFWLMMGLFFLLPI